MSNQILRNLVRDISLVLFWVGVWEATTIMIEQKNKASKKSMIIYIYLAIILSNPKRNLTKGQILAGFCRSSL